MAKAAASAKSGRPLRFRDRWKDTIPNTWCSLCRFEKSSPKAFSKQKDLCLSCSMRDLQPVWINTANKAVRRWREGASLNLSLFSLIVGWPPSRQYRVEHSPRLSRKVATHLAKTFIEIAMKGHDISTVVKDWPLMALLVPDTFLDEALEELSESL